VGLFLALFLSACEKAPSSDGTPLSQEEPPVQGDLVSTFSLVGHAPDGRKKWVVEGQTANLLEETVHLSPVAATSFGATVVHLTAKEGDFYRASQNVHLQGYVVVTTSEGTRLATESLDWVSERGMGKTTDKVVVDREGMRVIGRGGISYPKVKRVRLEKEITVTLQGEKGLTVVTCEGPMEVDYGRRLARFWRNVRVDDQKGFIQSDRMDAVFDSKNQLEKATFYGHVEIHHGSQVAFAQRANYWQPLGQTRLVGHPRLVMLPEEEYGQ